jgi:hypothetical protein
VHTGVRCMLAGTCCGPCALQEAELDALRRLLSPAEYPSELQALRRPWLPGSRKWLVKRYNAWLALPSDHKQHRAFVLYGGPGMGKSTFAAALCSLPTPLAGDGGVAAYYFCKQQRGDAACMLRSLVFQLAALLPALQPLLMRHSKVDITGVEVCCPDYMRSVGVKEHAIVPATALAVGHGSPKSIACCLRSV